MDFQQFKNGLEGLLKEKAEFELQEFQYFPYCFGHGTLAYRIKGYNVRFTYDGRDNLLTCERSNFHEKYTKCSWTILFKSEGLIWKEQWTEALLNI